MKRNQNIPAEYQDYWYLGAFDLKPSRLGDSSVRLSRNECRNLRVHGWLFASYHDAVRVRDTMLAARLVAVVRAKGFDGAVSDVVFNLPTPAV